MKRTFKTLFLIFSGIIYSGNPVRGGDTPSLQVSAYAEVYYAFDAANPADHNRPAFVYSHNRHNEVNLNLGFVKTSLIAQNYRANMAIMAGTYANANLAAEPGVLRNIFEANVGVKLSRNRNIWADAGIMPAHIGFESAIGKDCWNLSRSIMADNSPYYESGVKLSYIPRNEKWLFSAMWLNGWQRIQRVPGNNTLSFGHQITYKPRNNMTLNSSSFVGSDVPDSLQKMRYFHNIYAHLQDMKRFGLVVGFDIGAQQKTKGSSVYNIWYTPVVIVRYKFTPRLFLAARGEYYHDPGSVIVSSVSDAGFKSLGYSLNMDVLVSPGMMWRTEIRKFQSPDRIFSYNSGFSHSNVFFITAFTCAF